MGLPDLYIPQDRRQAIAKGEELPDRTQGTALFADISGFTPLTETLVKELGPRRGADELTKHLNHVYNALIAQVHLYGGNVIGFSGDAITCWFDNDKGIRAIACGLAMQRDMAQIEQITTPAGSTIRLGMKAAIVSGPARRFCVGDPHIQYIDVLAGHTLDRMAAAERQANRGEVLVSSETVALLNQAIFVAEWRGTPETGRFALVTSIVVAPQLSTLAPAQIHLSEVQVRPWVLPPIFERLQAGQGNFLAEIRPAVALFLKFGGLNYDQDDKAGQKLDEYIRWVQRTLARYEGYLIQLTVGDKGSYIYAAFGAPLAHDDDPTRAVAAALELRSPPPELDFIGPVQIGLSQGRMRAGAYGSLSRQTYGVLGDETNMAARLMNKAKPGQILVSQRVADVAGKSYHLQYLGPIKVKGRDEPLSVSLVLEPRLPSSQQSAAVFNQVLVGREIELAQLDKHLAAVLLGEGHVLRLEGMAGVGKSHLSAIFMERARQLGFYVGLGACQSTSQNIAYYPWRHMFRALFKLTDETFSYQLEAAAAPNLTQLESAVQSLNPDWRLRLPLLGDLLGLSIPDNPTTAAFEPQLRQEALITLAVEMIQKWAKDQPLLLLIEDAHWVDEASWRLILALGRVIAGCPRVLLALVYRPLSPGDETKPFFSGLEELPDSDLVYLNELSPVGVTAMVANRLQGQPTALAASLIQLYGQGNPFYTEELVDTLRETGKLYEQPDGWWNLSTEMVQTLQQASALVKKDEQWMLAPQANLSAIDLGIPDSIHGIVLSRLDRLSELHKLTLKVASVIGRVFELEVLTLAHPLQPEQDMLLAQIQGIEGRDFVRLETPQPQLSYMFKHNITREVVYQTLLANQQSELHQAVAEALERLQPKAVERLAYHYRFSQIRAKALFYLDKAARKAQLEYANEMALNYYSQALELEERWEYLSGKIEVLHILGRREEEHSCLQALIRLPAAPAFEAAYQWGQYFKAIGEYPQAQAAIEQALAACQAKNDLMREAHCLTQLGLIANRQGDYERAKVSYNHALDIFQDQETVSDEEVRVLAQAFNGLGTIYRQQGNFEQAIEYYAQALVLSHQSGDRQREAETFNHLGVIAYYQRQFTDAQSYHQQALRIRQSIGDRVGEGTSLTNLSQVTRDAGHYGQAQQYLTTALALVQATGDRWQEVNLWNDTGILYQELGDFVAAQTCLERGLRLAQQIGDEVGQAYLESNLGLVLRDQGDLTRAEEVLKHGLNLHQRENNKYQIAVFLSYMSTVSLQAGQIEQAIEQAQAALALRQGLGMRLNAVDDLAILAKAYLNAGDITQALAYARQTLAILEECKGQGPEFPHRDYFIGYQVMAAVGEKRAAQVALQAAYDLVMARAEKITDSLLHRSFLDQVAINRDIVAEYLKRKI